MTDFLFFIIIGLLAGFFSGLLGLGGGVIMVPGLYEWVQLTSGPVQHAMQLSVGTALSAMMITSLATGLTHQRYGQVRWDLVRLIAPGMVIGVIGGVQLIDILASAALKRIFSVALLVIALQLLFFHLPKERATSRLKPWVLSVASLGIGVLAGLLGLGGGLFLLPMLIYTGLPLTQCASTSIWCTLPTVTVGAVMAYVAGANEVGLPPLCLGYVYWPATLGIGLTSLISAPFGVYLALKLPKLVLQKLFAVLLCVISIRMMVY